MSMKIVRATIFFLIQYFSFNSSERLYVEEDDVEKAGEKKKR